MPRPLRPALTHGTYHITAHGVGDEIIFRDDADRAMYLSLLQEHAASGVVRILAYVLMSNHVHLVLSTSDTNLSSLVQRVHGIYGARFNRKYGRKGHLFGSRFYSDHVETDEHLLASTRYIHRNPVQARMVERPEYYPWSSYRAYLGMEPDGVVDTRPVLQYFATDRTAAIDAHHTFVMQTPDLAAVLEAVNNGQRSVRDLIDAVADILNLSPTAVEHRTRGRPARHLSIMLLRSTLGWTPHRIAEEMRMSLMGVVGVLEGNGQPSSAHGKLQGRFEEVLELLGTGARPLR